MGKVSNECGHALRWAASEPASLHPSQDEALEIINAAFAHNHQTMFLARVSLICKNIYPTRQEFARMARLRILSLKHFVEKRYGKRENDPCLHGRLQIELAQEISYGSELERTTQE